MKKNVIFAIGVLLFAFGVLFISILRSAAVRHDFANVPAISSVQETAQKAGLDENIGYWLAYPGPVLPDHPLWFAKAARDKLWLMLTTNQSREAELNLLFADKRANASLTLFSKGNFESIFRNSRRRICELMRHPILSIRKEFLKLGYCPLDGSKLMKRKGLDDPETIKVRLKQYEERTLPVLRYLKKESFTIRKINGEQSVVEVFNDILKAIK